MIIIVDWLTVAANHNGRLNYEIHLRQSMSVTTAKDNPPSCRQCDVSQTVTFPHHRDGRVEHWRKWRHLWGGSDVFKMASLSKRACSADSEWLMLSCLCRFCERSAERSSDVIVNVLNCPLIKHYFAFSIRHCVPLLLSSPPPPPPPTRFSIPTPHPHPLTPTPAFLCVNTCVRQDRILLLRTLSC